MSTSILFLNRIKNVITSLLLPSLHKPSLLTLIFFEFTASVELDIPKIFSRAIQHHPLRNIDVSYSPLGMANHELHLTAFAAHRMNRLRLKRNTVETHLLYHGAGLPVPCPTGRLKMTVKPYIHNAAPSMQKISDHKIPLQTLINNNLWKSRAINSGNTLNIKTPKGTFILCPKTKKVQGFIPPAPSVSTVHMHVESTMVKR